MSPDIGLLVGFVFGMAVAWLFRPVSPPTFQLHPHTHNCPLVDCQESNNGDRSVKT